MKKFLKIIAFSFIGIIILGGVVSLFDSPKEKAEKVTANTEQTSNPDSFDFETSSSSLYQEFQSNGVSAEEKYKGKKIKITGEITVIQKNPYGGNQIHLKATDIFSISCDIADGVGLSKLSKGATVSFIGEFKQFISPFIYLHNCR